MDWENTRIVSDLSIRDAIIRLDAVGRRVLLAVSDRGKFQGLLTDGDIRRAILNGVDLSMPVSIILNRHPLTAQPGLSREDYLSLMRSRGIFHLPLVDDQHQVKGLVCFDECVGTSRKPNEVVLFAGGLGRRLGALTQDTPKPMLPIRGRPILENIVRDLVAQGFWRIHMCLGYKGEAIEKYFGDGSSFGTEISYTKESKPLGTAGALSLIELSAQEPLLVMNADVLTACDFSSMIRFHKEVGGIATMAVREHEFQVAYGLVHVDQSQIKRIEEKPIQNFYVNAGIYVLDCSVLSYVRRGEALDMTTFFEELREAGHQTFAYPLREYWVDVGSIDDFERASREWPVHF